MAEVKRQKDRIADGVLNGVLIIYFFIAALFPIVWVFSLAFKTQAEILSWPPTFFFTPTLNNFRSLLLGLVGGTVGRTTVNFLRNFGNSLIISIGSVALSILVGVPATYAIARFSSRERKIWRSPFCHSGLLRSS